MAYVIKPCRGCGGPKDETGRGIRYCFDCKLHIARLAEQKRCRPSDVAARDHRISKMAELYKRGQTLQQIGTAYGITRERVRQLIKSVGLTRKDGGIVQRGIRNRRWKEARLQTLREQRHMRAYGCTEAEYKALNLGPKAKRKGGIVWGYRYQKHNAELRGIEWRFSLVTWYAVWVASGHIDQRGRGGDSYVMARFSDSGPYCPENVYITTGRTNNRDYQMLRLGRKPSYAVSQVANSSQ